MTIANSFPSSDVSYLNEGTEPDERIQKLCSVENSSLGY